ncbi:MAG: PAS domain-containing protein [Rhizobacter sp.]
MGERIERFDWSQSPLGPVAAWPQSIKTTVALLLRSPVPIVTLWGEDGVMIYNNAYAVFASNRHPQILGSKVREGWPEVADFNDHVMKVCLAGGTLGYQDQELTLHRTQGHPEQVWMNLDYSPILDEAGVPSGVIAIVVETTAKVLSQRALRDSEAQFRVFAQAMPNHVWSGLPDGGLDWFNDRVYEYSGAKPGELDGTAWASIVFPDDLPDAAERWAYSLANQSVYETEFRIRQADGGYRWHIVRAAPIRDESGRVTRWIGTNTDIEHQKATAAALAHLNLTLEDQVAQRTAERDRIWRLSTDLMVIADFETKVTAINPALGTLLGWAEHEFLGRSFLDFVHPDDMASTTEQMSGLARGQKNLLFENRYRSRDGSHRIISWTAVPDERLIYAVGRDVTADREAAQALRASELALQQAQKMEAIGQLTGGVAHDFNNILQVISANLHLLSRETSGNERATKRVASALASVGKGAKLASHLLAFGRRQPLEPLVVNIGRLVSGMEEMLRRTLGESIEVETVVSGGLWNCFVDPAQVENAILNLAINARDAMDGVGKLTIETVNATLDDDYALDNRDVQPGQYVMLAVSDTGAGMAADVLAKAFEPFFSTKPEGKGTGLGLSMVYGFVKQSGGHARLYSEVGHGTTVKVYLPRSNEAVIGTAAPPVIDSIEGGSETILVAEDDEGVRLTVVEMLLSMGYRVLSAKDAESALAVLQAGARVDLLFTDVVMPGPLSSPELARQARKILPGISVLFTSGYTENAIVHGGRLDAGTDLLSKPYSELALARKVRSVLAITPGKR